MKIFIDSADLDEIKEVYSWGIIEGITTNPSLIKKANEKLRKKRVSFNDYIKEILIIAKNTPVSLEVTTTNHKNMVKEGEALYKKFNPVAKNVYIKVPIDPCFEKSCSWDMDGVKTIKELSKSGIPVNATLIFTPEQALIASKAGAKFVSPYVGREDDFIKEKRMKTKSKKKVDDNGIYSGIDLIKKCKEILKNEKTEVLAASIRNPRQLREAALAGADIVTAPYKVLKDSLKHKKTFEGMKRFVKDSVY